MYVEPRRIKEVHCRVTNIFPLIVTDHLSRQLTSSPYYSMMLNSWLILHWWLVMSANSHHISVVKMTNAWFSLNDSDPCCCLPPIVWCQAGPDAPGLYWSLFTSHATIAGPGVLGPGNLRQSELTPATTDNLSRNQLRNWMKFCCIFDSLTHYTMYAPGAPVLYQLKR